MIRIFGRPLRFTAAIFKYLKHHQASASSPSFAVSCRHHLLISRCTSFSTDSAATNSPQPTRHSELARVATLVDGCDYEHWLVVAEPPKGYPSRSEIVHQFIGTLAMALGSVEEAKKSIYSVSTKYYYAFGCKIPANLTHKIRSLPSVRWVLPDSYLCHEENSYGGEPFVEGDVVPYDEKYHADWLQDRNNNECHSRTHMRKARIKERKKYDIVCCWSVARDASIRGNVINSGWSAGLAELQAYNLATWNCS